MSIQLSVAVRNARLAAILATVGAGAVLKIYTGSVPASCATGPTGTVLATVALPTPFMGTPSGGVVAKSGTWDEPSADASGTAGYYRLLDSSAVCHEQGTVTATGGGGDMTVNNVVFAAGQDFSVTGYTLTDANA